MFEDRILSREVAAGRRQRLRKTGEKLVMTNGVFDLLHVGHLEYLLNASKLGTHLWIALNSDESVRRLKGEKRPLVPEAERAAALLALRFVDAVVIFGEDTPEELYSVMLPDVLVKGADYSVDQIAGARQVIAAGGRVELMDFVPNHSTSNLIDTILTRYGTH